MQRGSSLRMMRNSKLLASSSEEADGIRDGECGGDAAAAARPPLPSRPPWPLPPVGPAMEYFAGFVGRRWEMVARVCVRRVQGRAPLFIRVEGEEGGSTRGKTIEFLGIGRRPRLGRRGITIKRGAYCR